MKVFIRNHRNIYKLVYFPLEMKRGLSICLIFILILSVSFISANWFSDLFKGKATGEAVSSIPEDSMTVHYKFDGNANDVFGNLNGVEKNGVTYSSGKIGQALKLDGVDDYINIATTAPFTATTWTVSMWIKPDSNQNTQQATLFMGVWHKPTIVFYSNTNNIRLRFKNSENVFTDCITSRKNSIKVNEWNHLAVVGDNGNYKIYINGVLSDEKNCGGISQDNVYRYVIGGTGTANDTNYFKGGIDDLRIYYRALNEEEIKSFVVSGESCETDEDCPSEEGEPYCSGKARCQNVTDFSCINNQCVEVGGGAGCSLCSNGCANGACISSNTTQCIDSDGGLNYYVKGNVKVNNTLRGEDYCTDDGRLDEYYCEGNESGSTIYTCPLPCVDGACVNQTSEEGTCGDLISKLKDPRSFVDNSYTSWILIENDSYLGFIDYNGKNINYETTYVAWISKMDDVDNYLAEQVIVFDESFDASEIMNQEVSNNICTIRDSQINGQKEKFYICNYDILSDYAPSYTYSSREIFWTNQNVLARLSIYEGSFINGEDFNEKFLRSELTFFEQLKNNKAIFVDWDTFYLGSSQEGILNSALEKCPSTIPLDTCSPCWSCKKEPVVCPEHGSQKVVCSDTCCDNKKESTQTCSPGICSGCYAPRWFGYDNGDNVCIPYGTRLAQTRGDVDEIRFDEGITIDGDTTVALEIIDDNSAQMKITPTGENTTVFEGKVYLDESYTLRFKGGEVILRVTDISPGETADKGYITFTAVESFNAYCNYDGNVLKQKTVDAEGSWATCQNNYECESNICSSGECIEVTQMMTNAKGFKSVIVKAWCRFVNPFSDDDYNQCVFNFLGA